MLDHRIFSRLIQTATFLLFVFVGRAAFAYPSFIGYGYTTCVTCHYSSTGNGPLTDYGRGIFSQEIAARTWIPSSVSDEDLAAHSNFFPGMTKPSWFRPHAKYRGLWVDSNVRSSGEDVKFYQMQRDLGATFPMGKSQRTIFTITYGMTYQNIDYYGYGQKTDWISREHYFRTYVSKKLLVAAGLMDIAYGIKHEDHTAINRVVTSDGSQYAHIGPQDNQAHGILLHYFEQDWDVALNVFAGNLLRTPDARLSGASMTGEYLLAEQNRIGLSAMTASDHFYDRTLFAIHDRWGNTHGSSLLVEVGLDQLNNKIDSTMGRTLGNYVWVEGLMKLTRGYNLLSTFERHQDESKYTGADIQKWSLGFLTFPFQRVETRFGVVQNKTFSPVSASDDGWALQGQVHVSL